MSYFVRTEESLIDINNSLIRGRSSDGWKEMGQGVWIHLYYSSSNDIKKVMLKLFNRKIEFLQIRRKDRVKAYESLINNYGINHSCSKQEYINKLSDDVIYRCIHPVYEEVKRNAIYNPHYKEKEIAQLLQLEVFNNGYIKYLKGLCALEMFDKEPTINDCTKMLIGEDNEPFLLKYLVCFEGEEVGVDIGDDWGEPWKLFKPKRIVWIEESGYCGKRNIAV